MQPCAVLGSFSCGKTDGMSVHVRSCAGWSVIDKLRDNGHEYGSIRRYSPWMARIRTLMAPTASPSAANPRPTLVVPAEGRLRVRHAGKVALEYASPIWTHSSSDALSSRRIAAFSAGKSWSTVACKME